MGNKMGSSPTPYAKVKRKCRVLDTGQVSFKILLLKLKPQHKKFIG